MSLDFFLGSDLFSLFRRYILLTLLRSGWFFINGGFYEPAFYVQESVTPLPWGYFNGTELAFAIVDGVLALGQIGLILGALRIVVVHHFPAQAVAWKLVRSGAFSRKPRRSIVVTALFLCSLVVLTCGLVPWAFQAWNSPDPMPFVDFLFYDGAPALFVGAILCLLGIGWGGSHSARAAQDMTTSFGITLVGENHWLYQRVKRLAEELGLPPPKVGITNVTNAFAMGSSPQDATVIIGQPLLKMEQDELDAIIGHELGHVMSNDVQRMQFAEGFQIMLGKVISFATIILAIFAAAAASQSKTRGVNGRMGFQAAMGVGNLVRGTVFVASELVVKGISRSREFHADAIGAQLTSTEAMVRALQRIHGVEVKATNEERQYGYLMFRGTGLGNLFGTHPTLTARVRSLEARARLSNASDRARLAAGFVPAASETTTGPDHAPGPSPQERPLAFQAGASVGRFARAVQSKKWRMPLLALIATIVILPALNSYYQLDRRAGEAGMLALGTASSSWNWVSETSQGLFDRWSGRSEALAARDRDITELKLELMALSTAKKNELSEAQSALAAATAQLDASRSATSSAKSLQRKAEQEAVQLKIDLDRKVDLIRDLEARLVRETQEHAAAVASSSAGTEETEAAQRRLNELLGSVTRERDDLTRQVSALELQLRARPPEVASADPAAEPAMTEDEKMALLKQVHDLTMKNLDMSQTISQWTPQLKQYQDTYYRLQQQEALNAAQAKNYEERIAQLRMDARAPTRAVWGAVVLDAQGKIFTVANQVSEQVAADTTRFACRGQDHRGRCEIIETYQNTCFAWARIAGDGLRPDNFAYAFDTNPRQAENIALTKCAEIDGRRCRLPSPAVCAPDQLNAN